MLRTALLRAKAVAVVATMMSVTAIAAERPAPANAEASRCPVVNTLTSSPEAGLTDPPLDLCTWQIQSAYGDFAPLQLHILKYDSCAQWETASRAWDQTTMPPPGMVGHTKNGLWTTTASNPRKGSKGVFLVDITFVPVPGTAAVELWQPTWPNMTAAQNELIASYMPLLYDHELGHANLAGHSIRIYDLRTYSVKAKNRKDAIAVAKSTALKAAMQANAISQAGYEGTVDHGKHQSRLGGTDLPSIADMCLPTATLLHTQLGTDVNTQAKSCSEFSSSYQEFKHVTEDISFAPPPAAASHHERVIQIADDGNGTEITCGSRPLGITNSDAAVPVPQAGEVRTVAATSSQSGQVVYPPTGVTYSSSRAATGSASAMYADNNGVLEIEGAVACTTSLTQSPSLNGYNDVSDYHDPNTTSVTSAHYRFTVPEASRFSLQLSGVIATDGTTSSSTPEVYLYRVPAGPDPGALILNARAAWMINSAPYSVTLSPGTYEMSFGIYCSSMIPYGESAGGDTADIHHMVTIGG